MASNAVNQVAPNSGLANSLHKTATEAERQQPPNPNILPLDYSGHQYLQQGSFFSVGGFFFKSMMLLMVWHINPLAESILITTVMFVSAYFLFKKKSHV